ncbi:MAG TPA: hypothetical protein VIY48_21140 [Candidatus Paceibacterota bacterium]
MEIGKTKTVFAWMPIPRMIRDRNFFAQAGWCWMRRVVVMWTFNGWIAYADTNG